MRRKSSDRQKEVHAAGSIFALLICFWIFFGGSFAEAAEAVPEKNSALLPGEAGNVSGNEIQPTVPEESNTGTSVINWNLTATPICYGQRLESSRLSGYPVDAMGNPVSGSFSWKEPDKVMTSVGSVQTVVIFTPETTAEGGQVLYGEPYPVTFWVTVEKNTPVITEWCTVRCRDVIYDGDTLREAAKLQGGTAVCEIYIEGKRTSERRNVPGNFNWKEAETELKAGTKSYELVFKPANDNLYQPVSTMVELEVLPRPVNLKLAVSDTTVLTGDEVSLTAMIDKTQKLQSIKGKVRFYADGEKIGEKAFTESESGWNAQLLWKADTAGMHTFYAAYTGDDHTAEEKSGEMSIKAVLPLTAFTTDQLPAAREGNAYKTQLLTDASGEFHISFALKEGYALPKGLTLNENSGEISGIPEESGTFEFFVTAAEKDRTADRKFELTVEEKLNFSLRCSNIRYGEPLLVEAKASPAKDFRYTCFYEGLDETVYQKSKTPPSLPGTYRVTVKIEEPEDYAGLELYQDFMIKKAVPKLTVSADPARLVNGGDCKLSITLQNPADPSLMENLPSDISVSFNRNVDMIQKLSGENGKYTLIFHAKAQNTTIRCQIVAEENSCYEGVQALSDVPVSRKEESKGDSKAPQQDGKDMHSSGKNSSGEPEKESEPEVIKKTAEEMEAEFWQDVIFRIYRAQEKGETVTINAKGHGSLPDKVLDALRQHEKVTLALVWEGDMIVIPAGKALPYEKEHKTWTLAELSKRYPLPVTETSGQPAVLEEQPDTQQPNEQIVPQKPAQTAKTPDALTPASTQEGSSQNSQEKNENNSEEAETETADAQETPQKPDFTEVIKTAETVSAMEEVPEGSSVDFLLVVAGVCAVCSVLVAALAVTAVMKGKRRNGE